MQLTLEVGGRCTWCGDEIDGASLCMLRSECVDGVKEEVYLHEACFCHFATDAMQLLYGYDGRRQFSKLIQALRGGTV